MTAITPEHGLRARLRRLASRTAVLAIVLGTCAVVVPSAASAAGASGADDDARVGFHISAGLRGLVAPGSATTAMLTVQNDTESKLSGGQVQVELSRTPLTDEASVASWLDDGTAPGEFDAIGSDTTAALDAGESAMTTVFVPAETLGALAPGVYPLRAELTGAKTQNTDDDDAAATTATSVLVVADSPDRSGRGARPHHGDPRGRCTAQFGRARCPHRPRGRSHRSARRCGGHHRGPCDRSRHRRGHPRSRFRGARERPGLAASPRCPAQCAVRVAVRRC